MAICNHAPADVTLGGPRMSWSQLNEYLAEVKRMQVKYQDQLSLVTSMECEYYPEVMDQFLKLKENHEIQCWILGQHESWDHRYNYFEM